MATNAPKERKSFGVVGLVVVLAGLVALLLGQNVIFLFGAVLGGAVGAVDWRTGAGKAAALLALVALVVHLLL